LTTAENTCTLRNKKIECDETVDVKVKTVMRVQRVRGDGIRIERQTVIMGHRGHGESRGNLQVARDVQELALSAGSMLVLC
jgi:hypothetical protein